MEVRGLPAEDDEWMAEAFAEDAEKTKVEVKKKEEVVEDSDDGDSSSDMDDDDGTSSKELKLAFEAFKAGGSVLACFSCNVVFRSLAALKAHNLMKHTLDGSDAALIRQSRLASYIECQLCFRWLQHDKDMLQGHLDTEHGLMSLKDYFARHVFGSREQEEARLAFHGDAVLNGTTMKVLKIASPRVKIAEKHISMHSKSQDHKRGVKRKNWNTVKREILLEDAPISRLVENKCLFRCPGCNIQFNIYNTFVRHKTSGLSCSDSMEGRSLMEFAVKRIAHACKICHCLVMCDRGLIGNHVKKRHGLPLGDYNSLDVKKVRLSKTSGKCQEEEKAEKLNSGEQQSQEKLKHAKVSAEVVSGCTFKCPQCSRVFKTWGPASGHRLGPTTPSGKKLNCSVLQRTTNALEWAEKIVSHICKLCGDYILCDRLIVHNHMLTRHRISVIEYDQLLKDPKASTSDASIILEQQQKIKERDEKSFQDLLKEVPIIPSETFSQLSLPPEAVPRELTTNLVRNFCRFQCQKCNFSSRNSLSFRTHVTKVCKDVFSITRHATEARAHLCMICAKRILCDRSVLSNHVTHHHKMTLSEYEGIVSTKRAQGSSVADFVPFGMEKAKNDLAKKRAAVPIISRTFDSWHPPPTEVPREQTTSMVEFLCRYRCSVCLRYETDHWRKLHAHKKMCLALPSNMELKSMSFVPEDVLDARYHFCFLCSARILCDRHFISKHLRGSHAGYSMAEYEKLVAHSGPSVEGAPRSALEEQGEAEKRVMAEVIPAPLPRLSKTFLLSELPPSSLTTWIGDACIFRCHRCEAFTTTSIFRLRTHLGKDHGGETLKMKPDRNIKEARYHKCKHRGCGRAVLCFRKMINEHLAALHNSQKLDDYEAMRDQNEDLEPEEAELGFPGRVLRRHAVGAKGLVGLRRPGVAYHQARRELEEAKGRIAPHKEPLPCFSVPASTVPGGSITYEIGDLCQFKCPGCPGRFRSREIFWMHYRPREAPGPHGPPEPFDPATMVAEARYHRCRHKGCNTAVLCDRHFIARHAKVVHGQGMPEYYRMPYPGCGGGEDEIADK